MVYNSPYQVTPPNYQVPYMSQNYQQQVQQQQNNNSNLIWVQGEGGAKAYPVGAGLSVVLFDSENERFYIKTTDQSGMPQPLRIFDYVERSESDLNNALDTSNFVTRDEFESAISKLKKQSTNKGGNSNGKSLVRRTTEEDD